MWDCDEIHLANPLLPRMTVYLDGALLENPPSDSRERTLDFYPK